MSSLLNSKSEILLPLDWLLKPFRKRFRFHFYGNKQTNCLEKVGSTWLQSVCVWIVSSHCWLISLVRVVFTWVLKVMCISFGFVLLHCMIGQETCAAFLSKHHCDSLAHVLQHFVSAAWLSVFTLSFDWFIGFCTRLKAISNFWIIHLFVLHLL